MGKYKNKYRIESHRKPNWDYSSSAMYFITLVVQKRKCILGEIKNNKIVLSDFGDIVKIEWLKSFEIREELFCDEYIIMPNHLHAIIVLDNKIIEPNNNNMSIKPQSLSTQDIMTGVSSIQGKQPICERKPKSISSFIAGFKSGVNSKIDDFIDQRQLDIPKYNRKNHFFQTNYHDHIIRNNASYRRIKYYIINNPHVWKNDCFNK